MLRSQRVGYHVVRVWLDASSPDLTPVGGVYTDMNVTADHTVTASFATNIIPTSITLCANHSSVARGVRVYFHGSVTPNRPNGTKVEFWVRKSGSTTWRRVSIRSTFSSQHWSYYDHPATHGTYYVKVRLWATSRYAASASRYIKVILAIASTDAELRA